MFDRTSDFDLSALVDGGFASDLECHFLLGGGLHEILLSGNYLWFTELFTRLGVTRLGFKRLRSGTLIARLGQHLTQSQRLLTRHFAHFVASSASSRTLKDKDKTNHSSPGWTLTAKFQRPLTLQVDFHTKELVQILRQ